MQSIKIFETEMKGDGMGNYEKTKARNVIYDGYADVVRTAVTGDTGVGVPDRADVIFSVSEVSGLDFDQLNPGASVESENEEYEILEMRIDANIIYAEKK